MRTPKRRLFCWKIMAKKRQPKAPIFKVKPIKVRRISAKSPKLPKFKIPKFKR